jgi:hypothetical protein
VADQLFVHLNLVHLTPLAPFTCACAPFGIPHEGHEFSSVNMAQYGGWGALCASLINQLKSWCKMGLEVVEACFDLSMHANFKWNAGLTFQNGRLSTQVSHRYWSLKV